MYILEKAMEMPSKQEYSYGRRAQSVTFLTQWKQIAMAETIEDLRQYERQKGFDYRIAGVGRHCLFDPLYLEEVGVES